MKKKILMRLWDIAVIACFVLAARALFAQEVLPEAAPTVATPPDWLAATLLMIQNMPVVGPVAVEVVKWLGVIASSLTILVTAVLAITRGLAVVLPAVRLAGLVGWLTAIENSKVMYWITMFSIYNAKKPENLDDTKKVP